MPDTIGPQVRVLNQCQRYDQPEPGLAEFRWVLQKDEIPGLCSGYVTLQGPIHKTPAIHDQWDQVYLIFSGSATIHLGDQSFPVNEPAAVIIPRGTHHSVELRAGEKLEYVFINQYNL